MNTCMLWRRKFLSIDTQLCTIIGKLEDFSYITPQNVEEEFAKFKKAPKTYAPQLEYKQSDFSGIIKELESMKIPFSFKWGRFFKDVRDQSLIKAKALQNIGTNKFRTEDIFGSIEKQTIHHAHKVLKQTSLQIITKKQSLLSLLRNKAIRNTSTEKVLTSKQLGQILKSALTSYNITDWKIVYRKKANAMVSVNPSRKRVIIRANSKFSKRRAKKLVIHEIGTHVLRNINGQNQEFEIFSVGYGKYIITEEGLAKWNERRFKVTNPSFDRLQAIYAIASNIGRTKGFKEVYSFVSKHISNQKKAFQICIRLKRGLSDTSKPGGFLKDFIYLQGELQVQKYFRNGGTIEDIYAGKIPISDISLIEKGILKKGTLFPKKE
jgi:hypothetical protein